MVQARQEQRQFWALLSRAATPELWGGTSPTQGHVQPAQPQKEVSGRTEAPQQRTQSTRDQKENKRRKQSRFAAACRALIANCVSREGMHVTPKEQKLKIEERCCPRSEFHFTKTTVKPCEPPAPQAWPNLTFKSMCFSLGVRYILFS